MVSSRILTSVGGDAADCEVYMAGPASLGSSVLSEIYPWLERCSVFATTKALGLKVP